MNYSYDSRQRRRAAALTLACVLLVGACEFDVVNPGPFQDENLDFAAAHDAMVNGTILAFGSAVTWVNFTGAAVARELFPSGSTAQLGITTRMQAGELNPEEIIDEWGRAHEARWMAENLLGRMEGTISDVSSYLPAAQLILWGGYANRLLGDNMCMAVFDGGPPEPHTAHFERAEDQFTRAMEIATNAGDSDLALAAQGGRASVRASLGNWSEAVSDAAAIPLGFSFEVEHFREGCCDGNRISLAQSFDGNDPHRSLTVWNTLYLDYYEQTGDPRTPWAPDPAHAVGSGARPIYVDVPYFVQLKYSVDGSDRGETPTPLTHYGEMQMILAEAELVQGNWQAAMDMINARRTSFVSDLTGLPLDPWVATNVDEAWTHLRRERGIELWLEGRRLGDLRRWEEEGRPGVLDPLELIEDGSGGRTANRDLCFPPSRLEEQSNPNLP